MDSWGIWGSVRWRGFAQHFEAVAELVVRPSFVDGASQMNHTPLFTGHIYSWLKFRQKGLCIGAEQH
jgi:hypothetical protein